MLNLDSIADSSLSSISTRYEKICLSHKNNILEAITFTIKNQASEDVNHYHNSVTFSQLKVNFLRFLRSSIIEYNYVAVNKSENSMKCVSNFSRYLVHIEHLISKRKKLFINPRYYRKKQNLLIFWNSYLDLDLYDYFASSFDPISGQVVRIGQVKLKNASSVVFLSDDETLIIGGYFDRRNCNSVKLYNSRYRTSREVAPLLTARSYHCSTVVNGNVIVCGGSRMDFDGGIIRSVTSLRSCELYSAHQNRWKRLPIMNEARESSCVVALPDGRVFVLGGSVRIERSSGHSTYSNLVSLSSVEVLNLANNGSKAPLSSRNWTCISPMKGRPGNFTAIHFLGQIFVVGDRTSVEMLSPPSIGDPMGQWTNVKRLKLPISDIFAFTSSDKLFVIGTSDNGSMICQNFQPSPSGKKYFRPHEPIELDDIWSWRWNVGPQIAINGFIVGLSQMKKNALI